MREHDHVELTSPVAEHPVGARGAIVSIGEGRALVEILDAEGQTLDLADLPLKALRRVTASHAA